MHSDALCLIIKKEHLEFLNEKCYSKGKEQPPTKWFGLKECNIENATPLLAKVSGVVFLCFKTLSDKRKYECQQCKDKHTKGHQVFEIKMIFVHQHHPHSM